jgi:catalase-peroxidase
MGRSASDFDGGRQGRVRALEGHLPGTEEEWLGAIRIDDGSGKALEKPLAATQLGLILPDLEAR